MSHSQVSAKLSGVHVFVRDMAATVAFYRLLGASLEPGAEMAPFNHVSFPGGAHLALGTYALTRAYDPKFKEPRGASPNALQFDVESREGVDAIYARLTAAGHEGHLAPHDAFWGARYAEVIDPDGNVVGFQSPVDPAKRSAPPRL